MGYGPTSGFGVTVRVSARIGLCLGLQDQGLGLRYLDLSRRIKAGVSVISICRDTNPMRDSNPGTEMLRNS